MNEPEARFRLDGRRLWVAGHRGMVGSAILRRLAEEPCEVVTCGREQVDLRDQQQVFDWVAATKPEVVILAAARVGGILANRDHPAEFIYDNLAIQTNVIEAARRAKVAKLVFLGSSCIYPKHAEQPLSEDSLLTGPLEATNEAYAIAKIAGIKLCQAYRRQYGCDSIAIMPTNLYGPNDNFDLTTSHVLPALLRRLHEARLSGAPTVSLWGTGTPHREFLHVEDCADAIVFLLKHYASDDIINVGTGQDISIAALAGLIADVVGYRGEITFDATKPDGTPRKCLDVSRLARLGWRPGIDLAEGIQSTYAWYRAHAAKARTGT